MATRRFCPFGLLLTLLAPALASAQQPLPTVRVAYTGDPAPRTGGSYGAFHVPSINPSGQILFGAHLISSPDVTESNDTAVFLGPARPAGPQLLAREGDPAPVGGAGATFGEITTPPGIISSEGLGLFRAALRGAPRPQGTFVGAPGSVRSVAPGGDPFYLGAPVLNAGPRAAFRPESGQGLLYWDGSNLTSVPTPDSFYDPTINRSGRITFTSSSYEAAYVGTPGDFRPFVASGGRAPGTREGDVFDRIHAVSQNDAGQVSLNAWVTPSTGAGRLGGVWAGMPDDLRLVALDGLPAPGIPGHRYADLLHDIDTPWLVPIDGTGRVAFTGSYVDGAGQFAGTAAWAGRPGDVRLLAKRGDVLTLPGSSGGLGTLYNVRHDQIWLNERGDVAMLADSQAGALQTYPTLLAAGADGDLQVIARVGGVFAVSPGHYLTVSQILLPAGTGGQDGRASALSESGQLVYTLRFEEGFSGVFVTTVPEPTAALFLLAGAMLPGLSRRRR